MKSRYADSLHAIEMSEERKDALVDMLAKEIEAAPSKQVSIEPPKKPRRHGSTRFKIAAAAACIAVALGGGGAAYAMDVGGVQRIVQVWVHGDQTDAALVVDNGTYTLDYQDADGNAVHRGGGGVVVNPDGAERPATEEELLKEINAPEVSYETDGRVIVYYLGQSLDITDKFEDGVSYVQLQSDGETLYMTIKYQGGYALSPDKYIQPNMFG
jgi:hypothetical protein